MEVAALVVFGLDKEVSNPVASSIADRIAVLVIGRICYSGAL
jgi:hypothetical protein